MAFRLKSAKNDLDPSIEGTDLDSCKEMEKCEHWVY